MSEPNVLVNFRLDRDRAMRIHWRAADGTPGEGYKAQVTAVHLDDGAPLAMDSSAIVEHTAPDPDGPTGTYVLTFNGMVGFAGDHRDRARLEQLEHAELAFDLVFVRDADGQLAVEGKDYEIRDRPRALAHKLTRRHA